MTICPVCQSKVNEKANFCSECGNQLSTATFDRANIVAMQERIKSARHNDGIYNLVAVVGILIAVAIPFVMHYVLHFTMDTLSWLLTATGLALFIGSTIGMLYDNKKVKEVIKQLDKGQE
jgi:VIT1/CCC1 family predicted Fe2+/Mn2+ transporter